MAQLILTHHQKLNSYRQLHCVKSVRLRRFSGPYSPAFVRNAERYGVSLRIRSKCGKIRPRKTPNTDTFHAALKTIIFSTLFSILQ